MKYLKLLYLCTRFNNRLNLVKSQVCKNIPKIKIFFDIEVNLHSFVSGFSIYIKCLDIQKAIHYNSIVELKRICLTRRTAQVFACLILKKVLCFILVLLNKTVFEKHKRTFIYS